MNAGVFDYDLMVIGSGPAGQKAAIQAAKAGYRVALVEQDKFLGGACVHRGTIPSKTLRENALRLTHLKRNAELFRMELGQHVEMSGLINRLGTVVQAHDKYMKEQIIRNHVDRIHGRGSFIDKHLLEITRVDGTRTSHRSRYFVIATGSHPRKLAGVPIDHEHIYDSDSILTMQYLPHSLTVLGSGLIASEYASIFQALGVQVTMIDRFPQPLGFLDKDLTDRFLNHFKLNGGEFIGGMDVHKVGWDGLSQVVTTLADHTEIRSEKLLCAAGRVANVDGLNLENVGIQLNDRGLVDVDINCRTKVDSIYAAGDVIGPPSLASASMEQGRRASRAALGLDDDLPEKVDLGAMNRVMPVGVYSIPEMSSVGLTEHQAIELYGSCLVGRAPFEEIARGQISDIQDGMLKMIADSSGKKLLGVQIVGEEATELIHIGQMGLINNASIDTFVDNIFNFPTLAEAYRVAALQIAGQRAE